MKNENLNVADITAQIESLTEDVAIRTERIAKLKKQLLEAQCNEREAYLSEAVLKGKITEEEKEIFSKIPISDFGTVKRLVDARYAKETASSDSKPHSIEKSTRRLLHIPRQESDSKSHSIEESTLVDSNPASVVGKSVTEKQNFEKTEMQKEKKDVMEDELPPIPSVVETHKIADAPKPQGQATALNVSNENATDNDIKKNNQGSHSIFSFKGRIRRFEYWVTLITLGAFNMFIGMLLTFSHGVEVWLGVIILFVLWSIVYFWVLFAQGAKRCHDMGNSGWYQIIPFYFLWMCFADGQKEENEYGSSPKYVTRLVSE